MATNVIFSISKPMFEVLSDIDNVHPFRAYIGWYDKRTLNALSRRKLIKFRVRDQRVSLTSNGECLMKHLKTYIKSQARGK